MSRRQARSRRSLRRRAAVWGPLAVAFLAGVATALIGVALFDDDPSAPSSAPSGGSQSAETASVADGVADAGGGNPAPALTTGSAEQIQVDSTHVQWDTVELAFEAASDHAWAAFPVQVTFEHTAGTHVVDGFWDGGRSWKVRFVPPHTGVWSWSSSSEDPGLDGVSGTHAVTAPTPDALAANANRRGHLRVSADGTHLVRADGAPFFFLGDTGWWFNSTRCPLEPGAVTEGFGCADYFDDRAAKGFTVVGLEMFDIHNANEGGFPFPCNAGDGRGNGDYSCLNPEHFRGLDARMELIWDRGLVAYANVSWLVGQLPNEATTPQDARSLGRYVMARYGWMPMVFSLSGEYQYGYDELGVRWRTQDWEDYGTHIQQHNPQNHPVTVHPSSSNQWASVSPGAGAQSSAGEFHGSAWLDVDSIQSGHDVKRLLLNPLRVAENASLAPRKPVLHTEGFYLEHSFNRTPVTDPQLRWQAYVPFLNGGAGHIYGANGIWQMYAGPVEGGYPELRAGAEIREWWKVMTHPSSVDVGRVRAFFEDVVGQWWALERRREWLAPGTDPARFDDYENGRTDPHLAGSADGSLLVAYVGDSYPRLAPIAVSDPSLALRSWEVRWFDPRTGAVSSRGRVTADGEGRLFLPDRETDGDWALVLTEVAG